MIERRPAEARLTREGATIDYRFIASPRPDGQYSLMLPSSVDPATVTITAAVGTSDGQLAPKEAQFEIRILSQRVTLDDDRTEADKFASQREAAWSLRAIRDYEQRVAAWIGRDWGAAEPRVEDWIRAITQIRDRRVELYANRGKADEASGSPTSQRAHHVRIALAPDAEAPTIRFSVQVETTALKWEPRYCIRFPNEKPTVLQLILRAEIPRRQEYLQPDDVVVLADRPRFSQPSARDPLLLIDRSVNATLRLEAYPGADSRVLQAAKFRNDFGDALPRGAGVVNSDSQYLGAVQFTGGDADTQVSIPVRVLPEIRVTRRLIKTPERVAGKRDATRFECIVTVNNQSGTGRELRIVDQVPFSVPGDHAVQMLTIDRNTELDVGSGRTTTPVILEPFSKREVRTIFRMLKPPPPRKEL